MPSVTRPHPTRWWHPHHGGGVPTGTVPPATPRRSLNSSAQRCSHLRSPGHHPCTAAAHGAHGGHRALSAVGFIECVVGPVCPHLCVTYTYSHTYATEVCVAAGYICPDCLPLCPDRGITYHRRRQRGTGGRCRSRIVRPPPVSHMRAVQYERAGDASVLQLVDSERPTPRRDEVRVAVRAASVNPVDVKRRELGTGPLPKVTGSDFAGALQPSGRPADAG